MISGSKILLIVQLGTRKWVRRPSIRNRIRACLSISSLSGPTRPSQIGTLIRPSHSRGALILQRSNLPTKISSILLMRGTRSLLQSLISLALTLTPLTKPIIITWPKFRNISLVSQTSKRLLYRFLTSSMNKMTSMFLMIYSVFSLVEV